MEKTSSLFYLILIQDTTELDMLDGLLLFKVELLLPSWLVSMHSRVELLQDADICTRRESNQEIWSFITNVAPRLAFVVFTIEVPTIGQMH